MGFYVRYEGRDGATRHAAPWRRPASREATWEALGRRSGRRRSVHCGSRPLRTELKGTGGQRATGEGDESRSATHARAARTCARIRFDSGAPSRTVASRRSFFFSPGTRDDTGYGDPRPARSAEGHAGEKHETASRCGAFFFFSGRHPPMLQMMRRRGCPARREDVRGHGRIPDGHAPYTTSARRHPP